MATADSGREPFSAMKKSNRWECTPGSAARPREALAGAVALSIALLVPCGAAISATCTSTASGDWSSVPIWSGCGGGVPGAGDTAIIGNVAHTVTVTDNRTVNALQFATGNQTSNLTISGGVTLSVNGSMTVQGQNGGSGVRRVDVLPGGRLDVGNDLILVGGSNNNRDVELRLGDSATTVVNVANDLAGTAAGGNFSSTARVAIRFLGQGRLEVGRNLGGTSTFVAASGTVVLDGSSTAQVIGSYTYHDLTVNKTGAQAAATTNGTVNIQGAFAVNSGVFNVANTTINVTGSTTIGGTLGITSTTGGKNFNGAVGVDPGGTWNNTANEPVTFGNDLTNGGTFNAGNGNQGLAGNFVNNGTFNAGTGTFTVNGNFTNNGTLDPSSGRFTFNSAVPRIFDGTGGGVTTFNNVTVNGGGGLTLGGAHGMTINTTLTLTSGQVRTGVNFLYIASGNAISSAGGADFVIGNLRKRFTVAGNNQARVFEVGTDAGGAPLYSPVNVRLGQVTAVGDFTVSTTGGDHPAIATSTLDATQSVNRYWTLVNDSVSFGAHNNNRIIFTFDNPDDLDAGAATGSFYVGRYIAPAWTEITPSARGATTTTVSGTGITMANVSADYQIGERAPAPPAIGGFNAYDTATAGGAISGFIRTKTAGAAISVDMVALNVARAGIETGFFGTVRVEVLDAGDNSGVLDPATGCRSSWAVVQTLSPDPAFIVGDNGRKTIGFTQANAHRDSRLRISYPAGAPASIGCSSDNFTIRPSAFANFSVSDDAWDSPGTLRPLTNVAVPGGTVHKAGRPFSVRAAAVNAAGSPVVTTNYDGTPEAVVTSCAGSACASGTGTFSVGAGFAGGQLASDVATYDEAGSLSVRLVDDDFAAVDAADGSTPAERNIESAVIDVGRFVPDRFEVALNTPVFETACGSGGNGFTYVGQPFNYMLHPVVTVTAVDADGGTTENYAGALWQITSASLTGKSYAAAAGTLDVSGAPPVDPVIDASAGNGTGTLTFDSGSGLSFTRDTLLAPFNAEISLAIDVIDADGVAHAANPVRFGQATAGNGIAFNDGKTMRFGRLLAANARGSQLIPLQLRMEVQYWNGTAFVTNTADTCTTIAANNIEMSEFSQNLAPCETSLTVSAFTNGRATARLSKPGAANTGSVTLIPRLEQVVAGSPQTCIAGTLTPVVGANRLYLEGKWDAVDDGADGFLFDDNPEGRGTFGVYPGSGQVIDFRENF
jgi:hypothetical protein